MSKTKLVFRGKYVFHLEKLQPDSQIVVSKIVLIINISETIKMTDVASLGIKFLFSPFFIITIKYKLGSMTTCQKQGLQVWSSYISRLWEPL